MTFDLERAVAVLERTPATLDALLRDLPDDWSRANEGPQTFSPYDVVGHLIHGERTDWMVRARIILEHGESRPFERYDRFAQEREALGRPLGALLDEFERLRRENLAALRRLNLGPTDLDRRGTHPILGTVTLRQLLATWAVHDLTHLHQISRAMAHQYRDQVGPWTVFLGVLRCQGHSD
jgi:DinB family protein